MIKITANRLLRLAERLKDVDPEVAFQLKCLATGALSKPHTPRVVATASLVKALTELVQTGLLPEDQFCLIGGLAVSHYVPTRATCDLDLLVLAHPSSVKALFPGGSGGALAYTAKFGGEDVDFLFASDFPWGKAAISSAKDTKALGQKVRVCLPEFLVLFKMASAREQDNVDIKNLLKLPGVYEKTKPLVLKYCPNEVGDLDQLKGESDLGL